MSTLYHYFGRLNLLGPWIYTLACVVPPTGDSQDFLWVTFV